MTFGERCTLTRKKKKISQAEMGKALSIDGDAYGRYERNEVKPSIEVAKNISFALDVSLDYLVGKTDVELDNETQQRILNIQQLPEKDKNNIFYTLDNLIKAAKLNSL